MGVDPTSLARITWQQAAGIFLELVRIVLISIPAWSGPCKFPAEYSKRVSLFERSSEHKLITSTDYDDHVRWSTLLVPVALCACVAFPLQSTQLSERAAPNIGRLAAAIIIAQASAFVCLYLLLPVCSSFGTDAKPLAFDVDGRLAFYLAALAPLAIATIDVVLCLSLDSSPVKKIT